MRCFLYVHNLMEIPSRYEVDKLVVFLGKVINNLSDVSDMKDVDYFHDAITVNIKTFAIFTWYCVAIPDQISSSFFTQITDTLKSYKKNY